MKKLFFVSAAICFIAFVLEASDLLIIPKNLGKPPLAPKGLEVQQVALKESKVQHRINDDFANCSMIYPEKNNSEIFELLLEEAEYALGSEESWAKQLEWQQYKELIWQEIATIENYNKVSQQLAQDARLRQQEQNDIEALLQNTKPFGFFKLKIIAERKKVSDKILQDLASPEEMKRLKIRLELLNKKLKRLK